MAGKRWRENGTWQEKDGGKLTIPAAVYFFCRCSGMTPQNLLFPLQIKPLKVSSVIANWQIFIFCNLDTNGLITYPADHDQSYYKKIPFLAY